MEQKRVEEIKVEIERQRKNWNDMMRGVQEPISGSYTLRGPVFRPHVKEEELRELLDAVEVAREHDCLGFPADHVGQINALKAEVRRLGGDPDKVIGGFHKTF